MRWEGCRARKVKFDTYVHEIVAKAVGFGVCKCT